MSSAVIDLAQPRTVLLEGKNGKQFKLSFRRLTSDDWDAFYDAITITNQRVGDDIIKVVDFETPSLILVDRALECADGYTVADADDPGVALISLPNWKQLIPVGHRLKAGEILAGVYLAPTDDDESVIQSKGETVEVAALWYSTTTQSMLRVSGLTHVLKSPTEAQHRRYAREVSRTRVLGGSRSGTTVYPGAQSVLADLYDELVTSVDGYVVDGKPLIGGAQIVAEMDKHHKVVAAQSLFVSNSAVVAKLDEKPQA